MRFHLSKAISATFLVLGCIFSKGANAAFLPSGVIVPLYVYPGDAPACPAWTNVTSVLQTPLYSSIQFYIVINPNSGPGTADQPDTNYQACVASLRTAATNYNNVKFLGYVPTNYGNREATAVNADIDLYSGWTSAWRPDGIFFDEVAATTALLSKYTGFANQVHSDFGTSYIILNPGIIPEDNSYYNIADMIVTMENTYASFNEANVLAGISSASPVEKQAIILNDGPTQVNTDMVYELSEYLHVGASYITNFANYNNLPTDLFGFLTAVYSAQTWVAPS